MEVASGLYAALVVLVGTVIALLLCACKRTNKGTVSKPVNVLSQAEQQERAEARRTRKMYAAGKLRECRFCEVPVAPEQASAHISGKKHRKLAGSATSDDDLWRWVDAPKVCVPAPAAAKAEAKAAAAEVDAGWVVAGASKKARAAKQNSKGPGKASQSTSEVAAASTREDFVDLPTLGFKLVDGVDKVLGLIIAGQKTVDLRSRGSRLSDGTCVDDLPVGFQFLGEPLAARCKYQVLLEVAAPVSVHESHGDAWLVHRERCLPAAFGNIRSAHEAQRFVERVFFDDLALVPAKRPVTAIPVKVIRVIEW